MPVKSGSSADARVFWKRIVEPVEPFLEQVAHQLEKQVQAFEPEMAIYTRYVLANQGKQLRPALVILSAGAVGEVTRDLVTVAVIIEMVHLATLIHDDVVDEGEMRRQQPTLAANWGNEISVLLGDCLFAHAVKLAASFPTPDICRAVAAATNAVCSGEILQNQQRGNFHLSRAEYFKILGMKTAELFALSCDLGAGLGGTKGVKRSALRQYGLALGTAYQLYDDCLDLFGTEASAGKTLGTDLANHKLTLPVLLALERATESDQSQIRGLLQSATPNALISLLEWLDKYDALTESRRVVQQFLGTAQQCLKALPDTSGRTALHQLTCFLAQQTDALGVSS
ncbi:MAG: polyprenyl synthetase family protein [Candidatus Omnitrophica bacterium]|nr:polyprenyl synthetase family protein [Candidatus Omnitrophota bacterium]